MLLGGPELLDLPSVKAEVERKISRAASGHIAFDMLRIRLLPAPRVELRGVSIDIPGQVNAQIESAQIGLRLRSLLHGQAEFTAIAAVRPIVRLELPPEQASAETPPSGKTASDPIAAYRSIMGPLAQLVHGAAPGALLEISDGEVILRGTAAPELRLRGLSLAVRPDSTGFNVEASTAGNLWDSVKLLARIEFADLSGSFGLDVTGLDAKAWLDDWFSGGWLHMDIPRVDLRVRVVTDARSELRCDLGIAAASLRIAHAQHGLPVSASSLKAAAVVRAHDIEVAVSELQIGSLIPAGRGTLLMTADGEKPRLEVDLPALDVVAAGEFVMALLSDDPSVRRDASRALGGAVTHLKMRSEGDNWHALIRLDRIEASAMLEHASVLVPAIEQEARELSGRIALAQANIELSGATAHLGPTQLGDCSLRYSIRGGAASGGTGFEVDLPQALAVARSLVPPEGRGALDEVDSVAGRMKGRADFASAGRHWNASIEISQSSALIRTRSLPWPVSLQAAQASISPEQVSVRGLQFAAGSSQFADLAATLVLVPEAHLTSASGRAMLVLEEIYPWLRSHSELAEPLADIDSVSGSVRIALNSLSGAPLLPSALAFDATVLPERVRVGLKGWPAELAVESGAVHIDPDTIRLDRVSVAMLDAGGLVSGELTGLRSNGLKVRAGITDALVGEQSVHWIWQRTGAPAQYEPRAPLHVALAQATWSPHGAIEAQASATFEAGPAVTVDLRSQADALDVRQLAIRDRTSDATFNLHAAADLLEAGFSGSIAARTIAAMFKGGGEFRGQASGELRVTLDLERRGRTSAQGRFTAQSLDLDELLPPQARAQARVDRLDLSADGSSLQIHEAAVSWAQQAATIRGDIARRGKGVVVDLEVVSPGIAVDALLHRGGAGEAAVADVDAKSLDTKRAELLSWLRALALSGQVKLRSDFFDFGRHRLAPVSAVLTFAPERAELNLEDTQLCGLSFPMTLQLVPTGLMASIRIQARKQQLGEVARCLTDQRVLLTGEFDASANLTMKGTLSLSDLQGAVHLESRNGVVKKLALIGNILAMKDVAGLLNRSLPDLGAEGFPYHTLDMDGHFDQGRLVVEDFTLDSSAFGLVAEGSVGLGSRDTQLTVLVAPFSSLTNLVRKVPIIGAIVGGTLTSVPVAVRGDIRDPIVVPFDPRAIASGLIALFTRALKVPERMMAPFESSSAPAALPGRR